MPRRRTQASKPKPTLQDEVDKVTQGFKNMCHANGDDGAAVKAFTNLQEAQISAGEHNRSLKRSEQETRALTMEHAVNMYVTTSRRMDKMFGLPEKSKKQHEMEAKRIFQNPQTFAEFQKSYDENQGEHSVLKVEFNHVSRAHFAEQTDQLKTMFNKLACHNCHQESKDGKALKRCIRCEEAYYCSKECQQEHWKTHKKSCKKAAAAKKS